jgi:hypothetical protein
MFCLSIHCTITPCHYLGIGARCTFGANITHCWAYVIDLPSRPVDEYKVASPPACGYFQFNHLVVGRYILADGFSPVRQARFILIIPEELTKSPYSRLLHQIPPLLTGLVQSLLPCTPRSSTRMDFSSEGTDERSQPQCLTELQVPIELSDTTVIRDTVYLRAESGLARDRRMPPFV